MTHCLLTTQHQLRNYLSSYNPRLISQPGSGVFWWSSASTTSIPYKIITVAHNLVNLSLQGSDPSDASKNGHLSTLSAMFLLLTYVGALLIWVFVPMIPLSWLLYKPPFLEMVGSFRVQISPPQVLRLTERFLRTKYPTTRANFSPPKLEPNSKLSDHYAQNRIIPTMQSKNTTPSLLLILSIWRRLAWSSARLRNSKSHMSISSWFRGSKCSEASEILGVERSIHSWQSGSLSDTGKTDHWRWLSKLTKSCQSSDFSRAKSSMIWKCCLPSKASRCLSLVISSGCLVSDDSDCMSICSVSTSAATSMNLPCLERRSMILENSHPAVIKNSRLFLSRTQNWTRSSRLTNASMPPCRSAERSRNWSLNCLTPLVTRPADRAQGGRPCGKTPGRTLPRIPEILSANFGQARRGSMLRENMKQRAQISSGRWVERFMDMTRGILTTSISIPPHEVLRMFSGQKLSIKTRAKSIRRVRWISTKYSGQRAPEQAAEVS